MHVPLIDHVTSMLTSCNIVHNMAYGLHPRQLLNYHGPMSLIFVVPDSMHILTFCLLTLVSWTADWHHPVISRGPVPVHLQLLANCGAAKHCILPGRAYGVCCVHLPSLQGAWSLQVLSVARSLLLHHCKAC